MFVHLSLAVCVALLAVVVALMHGHAAAQSYTGITRPYYTDINIEKLEKVDGVDESFVATFTLTQHMPTFGVPISTVFPTKEDVAIGFAGPLNDEMLQTMMITTEYDFANSNDVVELRRDIYFTPGGLQFLTEGAATPPPNVMQTDNNTAWLLFWARYSGTFKVDNMQLHDFPYDRQTIPLVLRLSGPKEIMYFMHTVNSPFTQTMMPMNEWKVLGSYVSVRDKYFPKLPFPFHEVVFSVDLERDPSYYVNKIVAGIVFLVMMSWWCFALEAQDSNRMAISATLFLAIVAYLFLVSSDVPKVAYTTRLDAFITWSMVNMFITYFHHAAVYYVDKLAKKAERLAEAQVIAPQDDAKDAMDTFPQSPVLKERWYDKWERVKIYVDLTTLVFAILLFVVGGVLLLEGAIRLPS